MKHNFLHSAVGEQASIPIRTPVGVSHLNSKTFVHVPHVHLDQSFEQT